jgi:hypothetical protein
MPPGRPLLSLLNRVVLPICAGGLVALGGCQTVGPNSIRMGREHYNSILQATSMEQTMSNIVRLYKHEPPMFLDVTEVDATLNFGGSITAAGTNIGAKRGTSGGTLAGQVGSVGGAVQYSETPTIRYQPLLGQALVAQLVTPVSVDALGLMYDSYWDLGPLLDFSSAYLTPDASKFYPALNTILELNHRGALWVAAAKSSLTPQAPTQDQIAPGFSTSKSGSARGSGANNDALVFYLRPFQEDADAEDAPSMQRILQLWVRMLRIYIDTQPKFTPPAGCAALGLTMDKPALRDWDVNIAKHVTVPDNQKIAFLLRARDCLPDVIELRVLPLPLLAHGDDAANPTVRNKAPVMGTYSALGILKNATERPGPKIEFVTPERYRQIRADPWNRAVDTLSYYTLTTGELDSYNCSDAQKQAGGCDSPALTAAYAEMFNAEIDRWIGASVGSGAAAPSGPDAGGVSHPNGLDVYETSGQDVLDTEFSSMNSRLGTLRRYMLVIVADKLPPEGAYASYSDGRQWYYISSDDTVSEKNFQLLSLFMTMMAIPPSTQPLSPVINVGGG